MAGPTITVSPASAVEGQSVTFTINLSEPALDAITVQYEALSATAERGEDFRQYYSSPLSGTLNFAPGESTQTITLYATRESLDERDEAFTLNLFHPVGARFETGLTSLTATGWVLDDDGTGPNRAIAIADSHVSEDGGTARFTVSLSQPFDTDRSFSFSTYDLTASAGSDYVGRTGTVRFVAGQTEAVIEIGLIDNGAAEMTERFGIRIQSAHGVEAAHATAHVADDDSSLPVASIVAGRASESQWIPFTVSLSEAAQDAVSVQYELRSGSGQRNVDWRSYYSDGLAGTLTFAPGETTRTVWTYVNSDQLDERDESVVLELRNPSGISFGGNAAALTAMGWALDDDGVGSDRAIDMADLVLSEVAGGKAIFTATLSEAFSEDRSFSYATYALTAVPGSDYTSKAGTVTFRAGQTEAAIEVDLRDDSSAERAESFGLRINAAHGVAAAHATALIQDDDGSLPTVSVEAGRAVEGQWIPYTVRLSEAASDSVEIDYQFISGTAERNVDWRSYYSDDLAGTLTFAAGETTRTVWTYVNSDRLDERDESVVLELRNPNGVSFGGNLHSLRAEGWALDDDGLGINRALEVGDLVVSEAAGGKAAFTLNLSEAFDEARSFTFATRDGSARAGSDFVARSGTVTFQAGQTEAVVEVDLINDGSAEAGESFGLTVTGNHGVNGAAATAFVQDDDAAAPIISIEGGSAPEGQWINYTVRLSQPARDVVTVDYATLGGLASINEDVRSYYSADLTGTLTFAPGDTVQSLLVYVNSDSLDELDENLFVQLRNPTGASFGGAMRTLTAMGWALDEDGIGVNRTVAVSGVELRETPGGGVAVFAVEISTPHTEPITLNYQTVAGTASAGPDFAAASGRLTFQPGQTRIEVPIRVAGDMVLENSESFYLRVAPPFPGSLSSVAQAATGLATIIDGSVRGTWGSDNLVGTSLADLMAGLAGNDTMAGRDGNDRMFGGVGNDRLAGDGGNDRLSGDGGNDRLDGGAGADTLLGGAGNDRLTGGSGRDRLEGGAGNDSYVIDRDDIVVEGANRGTDRIIAGFSTALGAHVEELQLTGRAHLRGDGNSQGNLLLGNSGNNVLNGRAGNDRLDGGGGNDRLIGGAGRDSLDGSTGNDRLEGGAGDDRLFGGAGRDTLLGGAGRDLLDGGAGPDRLEGGGGNDTYVIGAGDTVVEKAGGGTDRIVTGVSFSLGDGVEQLQLTGRANLSGSGNNAANLLLGNAGNNILNGRGGNDRLDGGAGNDRLDGGDGNDTIRGGFNADTLLGGGGRDILRGEGGTDVLTGGAQADIFVFAALAHSRTGAGRDRITDFQRGLDDIDLRGLDAHTGRGGDQAFAFGGREADAHAVWFAQSGRDLIVRADVNGDARADFEILVNGTAALSADDFLL